jgi:hypothetical protein
MNADEVLHRMGERLRPYCGSISESEIKQLAAELFLLGARFGLAWVEGGPRERLGP